MSGCRCCVDVIDDAHDEGTQETTLRLSNPVRASLADRTATGRIRNTDPMPRALMARFGWTAAVHVDGVANGSRLDAEIGDGLPVGRRFVGTPRIGVAATEHGRDDRIGDGLGVLGTDSVRFELGVEAQRRESPAADGTDHGVLGKATMHW